MKIFYHSADLDGACSGAIVKHRFSEATLHPINYGDPFPWENIVPGEGVWLVDFCLETREDMERLNEISNLIWIDHHKTSVEAMERHGWNFAGEVLIGQAGCELTWSYLHPEEDVPEAVRLLGRYDVWDHSDPNTLNFQYGMKQIPDTKPDNQELWSALFTDSGLLTVKICDNGAAILAYETRRNERYAKSTAFVADFEGLRAICINRGNTNSLVFKSVYDPAKHDLMIAFVKRPGKWTVSLYSDKPEVDCSALALARGGGGHHGAAGFQCQELPFVEVS